MLLQLASSVLLVTIHSDFSPTMVYVKIWPGLKINKMLIEYTLLQKFNVWVFSFKKTRRSDQLLRVNLIPWPLLAWFWSQDTFWIVYISGGGTDILRLQAKRNNNNKKWFLLLIFIIPLVGLYCRFKNKVPFWWFWKETSGMQWTSEMWRNIHVPDLFFVSCGKTFQ